MGTRLFAPETVFHDVTLEPDQRVCTACRGALSICCHRHRRLWALETGATHLVVKLVHCETSSCPQHARTVSPLAEGLLAPKHWHLDWKLFSWIGHRVFTHHWSTAQLGAELRETHGIQLSPDALEDYSRRYQTMAACRELEEDRLRQLYVGQKDLVLTMDGLKPEVGHETLLVVRELRAGTVWLCEPIPSPTTADVCRLLARVKARVQQLGLPVTAWVSDTEDMLVKAIAAVFPTVPHQYCANHFLRDAARPVLTEDGRLKAELRTKVRGLRTLERLLGTDELPLAREELEEAPLVGGEQRRSHQEEPTAASRPEAAERSACARPAEAAAAVQRTEASKPTETKEEPVAEKARSSRRAPSSIPPAFHAKVWQWHLQRKKSPWIATQLQARGVATSSTSVDRLLNRLEAQPPAMEETSPEPTEQEWPEVALTPAYQRQLARAWAGAPPPPATPEERAREQVVLDYCAVVRGLLTDNQGGPLHPPGLRMAQALEEVQSSLARCAGEKKGGAPPGRRKR